MSNFFSDAHPVSLGEWSNRPSSDIDMSFLQRKIARQNLLNPVVEVLHPIEYYAKIRFNRYVRKKKITVDLFSDRLAVARLWDWCLQEGIRKYKEDIQRGQKEC